MRLKRSMSRKNNLLQPTYARPKYCVKTVTKMGSCIIYFRGILGRQSCSWTPCTAWSDWLRCCVYWGWRHSPCTPIWNNVCVWKILTDLKQHHGQCWCARTWPREGSTSRTSTTSFTFRFHWTQRHMFTVAGALRVQTMMVYLSC